MLDLLLNAHSGWRYLVIFATLGMILFFAFALVTRQMRAEIEKRALLIWAIVLDIQLLLGLLLLIGYIIDGKHYGALVGHWMLGIVTVFLAHVPAVYRRLNGEPPAMIRRGMGLGLPILAFITIYLGLTAIDRVLFG